MKKPLIIIAGPTACGKTSVSIELAKKINGEIISADSMQVYKYMDIGTAKIKNEQMFGINHYLIDELLPDEEYSVAVFQKLAKKYIDLIYKNNNIPILVGGTGFYINALVNDNNFMSTKVDIEFRNNMQIIANKYGNEYIYNILKKYDIESAKIIHPNNIKRVIRALEYFKQTGKPISQHNIEEKNKESFYKTTFIILYTQREQLYKRINERVDQMLKDGLVNEVKFLLEKYNENLVSMKGIGYKEIIKYLKNEISLDEAIYILKKNTRHFAKRQLTWFKHQCNGTWIDVEEFSIDEIINKIISIYNKTINIK